MYSDISLIEYPNEISLVIYSPKCNMACPWCFNPTLRNKEPLSFFQVKEMIDEHRDFISAVVLSGGEPSLIPHLNKIISYIKSNGLKVKINTNGIKDISKHVDYYHVSLNPFVEEYNFFPVADIVEYSFVYSRSFLPKQNLIKWAGNLNKKVQTSFFDGGLVKPDIFTISQMQTGDCLNKHYNNCYVPSKNDIIDIIPLFKNIPKKKIIIETKEQGREFIKFK